MCRELRVKKRLKQREVAHAIGVKLSTYGNTESSPHKVIGLDKVHRMIDLYGLTGNQAKSLIDAWERVPLSQYSSKLKKNWERRNLLRSKAKHYDRMMRSLAEVLGLALQPLADFYKGRVCSCAFDREEPCEVCMALENLGLDRFTTIEVAQDQIAKLQNKLEAQRAAAAQEGAAR